MSSSEMSFGKLREFTYRKWRSHYISEELEYHSLTEGEQAKVSMCRWVEKPYYRCIAKEPTILEPLLQHETSVMIHLNKLGKWCFQIPRLIGVRDHQLLMEYMQNIGSFEEMTGRDVEPCVIESLVQQVLFLLVILDHAGITHYDLHTQNVLVNACDPKTVIHYKLRDIEAWVPTYGYVAILIDFGFAFCEAPYPQPMTGCIFGSDLGYFPDRNLKCTDVIRFLNGVRGDLTPKGHKLNKWIRDLMRRIPSSARSGWDKSSLPIPRDEIHALSEGLCDLMKEWDWIEKAQVAIQVPLVETTSGASEDVRPFQEFATEWHKVEKRVSNTMELFSSFVKCVVKYRAFVMEEEFFEQGVDLIKRDFIESLQHTVKYFCPDVCYETLVSSFILMIQVMEAIFYRGLKEREEEQRWWKRKLRYQSPLEYLFAFREHFCGAQRIAIGGGTDQSVGTMIQPARPEPLERFVAVHEPVLKSNE